MLDVSMVLADPLISDEFDVKRQAESVGANGRTAVTPEWFYKQRGVVKADKPSRLSRRDDGQIVEHSISVISAFSLRDATLGYQPDVVLWGGREYLVVQALPYQRVAGFTWAKCTSTRATDNPQ